MKFLGNTVCKWSAFQGNALFVDEQFQIITANVQEFPMI
jgi:hypothetical protein